MMTGSLYYLGNARSAKQRAEMVALEAAGICIFCPDAYGYSDQPEVLLEYEDGVSYRKQVLLENDTWVLLVNEYPYQGTLHHLLMVPRDHVTMQPELSPSARLGYFDLLDVVYARYGHDNAGHNYFALGSRNGDMRYTGATIAHLHIQFVVGNPDNDGPPVVLYVSSRPQPSLP